VQPAIQPWNSDTIYSKALKAPPIKPHDGGGAFMCPLFMFMSISKEDYIKGLNPKSYINHACGGSNIKKKFYFTKK
jgi:hypothetical protein